MNIENKEHPTIIRGGINDKNSKFYGEPRIPQKYIKNMDVKGFIKSNFLGDFLGETLKNHELMSKNFTQLERKYELNQIIQDYFYTNVEECIQNEDEKKFIILLNSVLADKIMSPDKISDKIFELVVEKSAKVDTLMKKCDTVVEEQAEEYIKDSKQLG